MMDIRIICLFSLVTFLWTTRLSVFCADCSTVFPGLPTFENCAYRCHCKNDAQCDEQTGSCDNGCEKGWMGPGCQYRNIARFHSRAQNVGGASNPADFTINAIDGDVTTCARTTTAPGPNYQSYFRIDWDKEFRIVGLVIKIHPDNADDFNRFRVETGTGSNNGDFNSICYQHDDISGTQEMEIMCTKPVWTKHLRIILDEQDTRLRVCEVEIYGGRDVAFNKPTNQTSTYAISFSSKSVDGQPQIPGQLAEETCSTTGGNENNPYWLVNFLAEYVVQSIYFYGRQENYEQYNGFQITLIRGDAVDLVYTDPANQDVTDFQPKIVDLTSQPIAGYLQVIRPRDDTLLTICEIVSFAECPPNKCGWDCTDVCHCDTEITGAFQKDGQCPYGCSDRWTGVGNRCDNECTTTQWGNQCQNECGNCHQGAPCDVVTGHCENGCSGPWFPTLCTQECNNNTYGINCAQTCGHCKDNVQCNISSGYCEHGCSPGRQPPMCENECAPGTYGDGCTNTCGNCLGGVTCNPVTGICPNGCDSGFYEERCNNVCGNCFQGVACNQTTGHCPNGCAAGFKGALCDTTCDDGEYGRDCAETCGNCNQPSECDKQTGVCAGVCLPGWQDDMCKTPCKAGSYGHSCSFSCGNCKDDVPCDHITGVCQSCAPGYKENMCLESDNLLLDLKENITVAMSSIYDEMVPEYAVNYWNGTRDPETCKCCSITTNEQISWWKVDLQNIYPLKEMHLYANENVRYSNQLNRFSVLLGNDSEADAELVFTDTSNTNEDKEHYIVQLSNRLSRIVTIQRFGTLAVCSVSLVEGECPLGYFGPHCQSRCHCADERSCNRNNGQCQSPVCKVGWTGIACNTECPDNTFGEGCRNNCFCKYGTCTKDYGICHTGCKDGFTGPYCNEEATESSNSEDNTLAIGIGVGVGTAVLLIVLIAVFVYRYRIYKREQYIKENYASTNNRAATSDEQIYDTIDANTG